MSNTDRHAYDVRARFTLMADSWKGARLLLEDLLAAHLDPARLPTPHDPLDSWGVEAKGFLPRSKPEPRDESDMLEALREALHSATLLGVDVGGVWDRARAVIAKHTAKQPSKPDLTCVVIDLRGALNARDDGDDSATEDYLYDALKALGASRWESEEAAWEHGRASFDKGLAEEAVQTHDADPLRESWIHGWRDRQREDAEDRSTPADVQEGGPR